MQSERFCAGIYSERKFLVEELSQINGVVSLKTVSGGLGFEFHQLRWLHLSNSLVAFSYARPLGKIDLGIRMVYQNQKIPGYENAKAIGAEFGAVLRFTEKVRAGIQFCIPGSKSSTHKYGAGIGYEISENVFVGAAISKLDSDRSSTNIGLIYRPAKQFNLKTGLITESRQPYFSAGWKLKDLAVEIATNYHTQLGMSPGIFITYQSPKK
ncbi:MAG TPA: hypothetical protein VJT83_03080 [Chitinophagaceae bacterium]|nr:hypothetical protein [Chitinophagaceae bacterium]